MSNSNSYAKIFDIIIIGGGIAGNYLAYLLSKANKENKNILLIEEHKKIGYPKHCTGLVTQAIKEYLDIPDELILNKLTTARIHIKDLEIDFSVNDLLLKRDAIESYLFNNARNIEKIINTKVKKITEFKNNENHLFKIITNKGNFLTKKIIGADGPNSIVRKTLFKNNKIRFYSGIQSVVKGRYNPKVYNVYFDRKYSDVMFAWIIPINSNRALVGTIAYRKTKDFYRTFLDDLKINKKNIIETFGGTIPIFNPRNKVTLNDAYLIGDSIALTKATTGGGIIPIFKAANLLLDSLEKNKSYEILLRKNLFPELKFHLRIHNLLKELNDEELYELFYSLKKNKINKILSQVPRDNLTKIFFPLLVSIIKDKTLLKYGLKYFIINKKIK